MKKLILALLLIPFAGQGGFSNAHSTSTNLVEVRSGDWPINLERSVEKSDTSFSLLFRDQQVMNGVVMDTLAFPNLGQLRYFEKALTALKTGTNGDIAEFKDYTIKRADVKKEPTWYVLRMKWGLTSFQQPESDLMIKTIRKL
jgi:hypothetical protein